MSREVFNDDCPGCKPVIIDPQTGEVLPETHEAVIALKKVWSETTLAQRQAFHRVTCLNSRDPADLALLGEIASKLEATGRRN